MNRVTAPASILMALTLLLPAPAAADHCFMPHSVFYPGGQYPYAPSADVVGRSCTIQLYTPAPAEYTDYPVDVSKLTLESDAGDIPFDLTGPTGVAVPREYGCDPPGGSGNTMGSVAYEYWVITPQQPLPSESEIRIMLDGTQILAFTTTANLDVEGCDQDLQPPTLTVCSPGMQNCIGDAWVPPPSDAGPSDQDEAGTQPQTDASGEPPPTDREGGCQIGGSPSAAGPGALLGLVLALIVIRRRR
jgi:hypothetical protein